LFIFLVEESLFDSFSINLIPNSHLQANSILVRQARLHAPLFSYLCTGLDPLIFCDSAFDFDDKKKNTRCEHNSRRHSEVPNPPEYVANLVDRVVRKRLCSIRGHDNLILEDGL